ncbi:methionyl-tRNA formyltransferase [Gammaproteobacteria bacterium]|nr:methionyl-tRNA formyltransferase [Gammaproteobacteria bacterium]
MKKLKIVFAGTPKFAENFLSSLIDSKHDVVCVFTQPSKRSGRGLKFKHSPVRDTAELNNIDIRQPEKITIKETDALAEIKPDLVIVVAYGLMLTKEFMSIPKFGCINVHPSLLPRWRGAAPIQRSIEAGDKLSGVTIMQMTEGLDKGDIIYQEPVDIKENDSSTIMHDKFITIGISSLKITLDSIVENNYMLHPQDDSLATYAKKITKTEAKIDWDDPAEKIHKKIMAFNIWPVAETLLSGERIRIHESEFKKLDVDGIPGNIKSINNKCIEVFTKDGLLLIKKLQRNNSTILNAEDFINSVDLKGKKFE